MDIATALGSARSDGKLILTRQESKSQSGEVVLSALFCDRCLKQLVPGRGEFFEVRIEAVADPTPPDLEGDLSADRKEIQQRFEELLAELQDVSPTEARDQVYRRVSITLCNQCYQTWIEDPAGRETADD